MRSDSPEGWREAQWGELVELRYGKALPTKAADEGGTAVFGTNGPTGRTTDLSQGDGPTVVIGRKGAYRGVTWVRQPYWVIDTAFYVMPLIDLNPRWMFGAMSLLDINGLDSGSAIPSTRREDFYALCVLVPPLDEQDRIASVLGALDDKIESNRRLVDGLNDVAGALFANRTSHRARCRVVAVQDVADLNAYSLSTASAPEHIVYIDISGVKPREVVSWRDMPFEDAPSRARRIVRAGDTIVSTVRPNRRSMAFLPTVPANCIASTGFAVVSPRSAPASIVYRAVTSDACIEHLSSNASGSAYPAVHPSTLGRWQFRLPEDGGEMLAAALAPMEAEIDAARRESRTLAAIRDELLPRLISGRLRVPDTKDPDEVIAPAVEDLHADSATED